jgi:hypothetical protein
MGLISALFNRVTHANVEQPWPVRADEVKVGMELAAGHHQCSVMENVSRRGEIVIDVGRDDEGHVLIFGDWPDFAWTLEPATVVYVKPEED